MDISLNGTFLDFIACSASLRIDRVSQWFSCIMGTEIFKLGDEVEIFDGDTVVLRCEVEFVEATHQREWNFSGRNKTGALSDAQAIKTVQFTKDQKLDAVLSDATSGLGVSIKGAAPFGKETMATLNAGEDVSEFLIRIANNAGTTFYSDADGTLLFEDTPKESGLALHIGSGILTSSYTRNETLVYDTYHVYAQARDALYSEEDIGAYAKVERTGEGKRHKTIRSSFVLDDAECTEVAKAEIGRDKRRAFQYVANIHEDIPLTLNTVYRIEDTEIGISEDLLCFAIKYTHSNSEFSRTGTFVRV